ncbi:Cleft lip and palate transmembrane protein 1-like protein [Hondaea fermentalgiana]|uniref:Cleft lip and palate transmembrane protein 1-like protein n=1 Tax=Hondaea fermentalgiana TaxID=2315210 RepID=A0A2R5GQ74_9STRA|nr:Cleft lip and palate transmembrane protein 1-like protein [Hondaea fermentalgiana]|eukprot:GBG31928.1 Cleft lip and palate transmembrane protein 1-like protein [Hondaea fermentalgiana]
MRYAPSFRTIAVAVFTAYVAYVAAQLRTILNPAAAIADVDLSRTPTWDPLWPPGHRFSARVWLTGVRPTRRVEPSSDKGDLLLWSSQRDQLIFDTEASFALDLNLTSKNVPNQLWSRLAQDESLYAVFCLGATGSPTHCVDTSLVKHLDLTAPRPTRYLVAEWPLLGSLVPNERPEETATPATRKNTRIGYWTPRACASLVADWTRWPKDLTTPYIVRANLPIDGNRQGHYLPVVYADQLGLTKEKLIQINTTNHALPLRLEIGPMSMARWQFNAHMEESLRLMRDLGSSTKDIDDLRHMLTETDPTLLAVTMLVSMVHLLLDVLALRSDISFWANTKSTAGLAVRPLAIDLISQVIIAAYLAEQDASLLVLGPSVAGILVQAWKVQRAFRLRRNEDADTHTSALDSSATRTLALALVPLVLGYTLHSLVREKHASFYAWAVGSLASCVYALGFVMMTPQIFINYKLKSVAKLPWEYFIYKFANTFIDDLFAFIIRMPTMHRAAVFRDDLVFFIYMYQRWIYPVDSSRREDGLGDETESNATQSSKLKLQ